MPTEAEWSSQTAARNNGNKSITTVKEEPAPTIANRQAAGPESHLPCSVEHVSTSLDKVASVTKLSVSTAPGHLFNPTPP